MKRIKARKKIKLPNQTMNEGISVRVSAHRDSEAADYRIL